MKVLLIICWLFEIKSSFWSQLLQKNHHIKKYIADELIEIISEIDFENIIAVITNNVNNMKNS